MRYRLALISTLALLGGAAPAIAKPLHCKHGYVRHGHRCVHVKVPFKAPGAMQGSAPNLSLLEAEWAAYRAAHQIVATEPPPLPQPIPPVPGPNRLSQPWTFTPGKITCRTEGQPAGKCSIDVGEAGVIAPEGFPPTGVEVEVEKQVLNATEIELTHFPELPSEEIERHHTPSLLVKDERIGGWNQHPFADVPTAWWTEREGEPACIDAIVNNQDQPINTPCIAQCKDGLAREAPCEHGLIRPIFRERDPGEEASPVVDNPIYVAQSAGGLVGLE